MPHRMGLSYNHPGQHPQRWPALVADLPVRRCFPCPPGKAALARSADPCAREPLCLAGTESIVGQEGLRRVQAIVGGVDLAGLWDYMKDPYDEAFEPIVEFQSLLEEMFPLV
jgi:hypothetical protein